MFDQTEDIDQMFDTEDFAEVAGFVVPDPSDPPDGTMTVNANIIFERNTGDIGVYDRSFFDEKFYALMVRTGKDYFMVPTHRVPTGTKRNTAITFRSKTYYVFQAPFDGDEGVSAIFVSRDQA